MTVINSFNFRCEIVLCCFFFLFVFVVHQVQKKKKKRERNGHKDTMYKVLIFQEHQVIRILKKSSHMKKKIDLR